MTITEQINEPCVACKSKPNCDNEWYKSGLCHSCLQKSRGPRCTECYNSPLYCVCKCACRDVEIGSYSNQIEVETPVHMKGMELGYFMNIRETICLDRCIAEEVKALWDAGIVTTGCCCGHNKVDGYIGVYDLGSVDLMIDLGYELLPGKTDHFHPKYKPEGVVGYV